MTKILTTLFGCCIFILGNVVKFEGGIMSNRNRQGTSRREFLRLGAVGLAGAALLRHGQFAFAQGTYTPPAKDKSGALTTYNWGNPDEAKVYADAFARFKQRYPNVAVTDNIAPVSSWADYADKLLAQVAGGKPPDIINIAIEGVQLAAAKGLLMPLNDYLKNDPDGAKLLADIPKVLLDSLSVDGKL